MAPFASKICNRLFCVPGNFRHTAVSLLYEQLLTPPCQQALQRFEQAQPNSEVLATFRKDLSALEQLHAESLSNVRFLSTLERSALPDVPCRTVTNRCRFAPYNLNGTTQSTLNVAAFYYVTRRCLPVCRYFTTLETGPLGPMADTIASLMNALRMVWVTSRHFITDERMQSLMERIAYQVRESTALFRICLFAFGLVRMAHGTRSGN